MRTIWNPDISKRNRAIIKRVKVLKPPHGRRKGAYGYYYNLNKQIGIKVMFRESEEDGEGWEYDGTDADDVLAEFRCMMYLKDSGCTPIPYCVRRMKDSEGTWRYAIFMQHVGNRHPTRITRHMERLHLALEDKYEMSWSDLHQGNVRLRISPKTGKTTKIYFIDFSPVAMDLDYELEQEFYGR